MSETKTHLAKSLQLLRDLNTLRRRRDWRQAGFVDGLLDDHDMAGRWLRRINLTHDAVKSGKRDD